MNKKISIIVPVYNSEKYLTRCLNSIINQTYKNLEIILIDDASTDKSKDIIKKYSSLDNRIKPIYSELNQGVSKTRNLGLKIFTGDYVFFVDADDSMKKNTLEIMLNDSIKYDADLVENYHLVIYEKNNKKYYFTEKKVPKKTISMGNLNNNIEILTKSTYITGKLIRRDLIENMYFNEKLSRYEDFVFDHQLKYKLKNMVFEKDVLYNYYQVSSSLTNTLGKKHEVFLDASKEVIDLYSKSSKDIKQRIEGLLFTNAFLTGLTKVVKNDDSQGNNVELLFNYLNKMKNIFKTYKDNKYINIFVKIYFNKLINNKNKIYKFIKKTRNIDFIKKYFSLLSVIHSYKTK